MFRTLSRKANIAALATAALITASALPAVSQARPIVKGTPKVTCPDFNGAGVGTPGELRTREWNVFRPDGSSYIEKETKICGSDGKWHTVVEQVQSPGTVVAPTTVGVAPEPAPVVTVQPVQTVTAPTLQLTAP